MGFPWALPKAMLIMAVGQLCFVVDVFFPGRCPRLRCVWPLAKLWFVGKAFVGNDKGVESGGAAGGVGVDQDSSSELDSS